MALSAPLLTRKKTLMVKIESGKGTYAAGDQAILAFDLAINPTAPFEERRGTGIYRGVSNAGFHGLKTGTCSFTTELRGTGSGGMEAGLAILLQACGLKKTSEVYQVQSTHTADSTISIDVWEDGVVKSLGGASGNVVFEGEAGNRMMCRFDFTGIWQDPVAGNAPSLTTLSTTNPLLVKGGSFSLDANSIKIGKYNLDMKNTITVRKDAGSASGIAYCMITDYSPTISCDPEADLIAGYDYDLHRRDGTLSAITLEVDNQTDQVTFSTPKVQITDLKEGDREGIQIYDYTGVAVHNAGDNSVVITAAAHA